ncbi:S-layer family protein [Flavonifractor plautii DSM 6740]|uniref:S-layer homology domain-containing protein n=1 Tax=Flavonifractor plautii TaxID=292800 RepID=UPI001044584E|nr:S-layer homology domain-containing protein [Flavonifractor plautii]TCP00346.1 S-layer family protein [Flavonifractor plautii DSM 6740]
MIWNWKRPTAFFLAAAMIVTMSGVPASAVGPDGSAASGSAPAECSCETHCEQGAVDPDCPVCGIEGADLTQCQGEANAITVEKVQELIDALPTTDKLTTMTKDEQNAVYADLQAAYEAYEALTEDEQALLTGTEVFESLFHFFNGMVNLLAENGVSYLDENGDEQTADNVTVVESSMTAWNGGWYVVNGAVTIDDRVTVSGGVHLILADNASLTVNGGINVAESNSFSVYAQSVGKNMGTLTVTGGSYGAGIGGRNGDRNGSSCGNITIHGGSVAATSGDEAAGIGGGVFGSGGNITINGGNVTASGGENAAGIGGGQGGSGGNITINGGSVAATGRVLAAGIGGGSGAGSDASGGNITINGGNVTATSEAFAAGIGGGQESSGGNITINGGTVTATGGQEAAGIGSGSHGSYDTITINGGSVAATGGELAAGIGGGSEDSGGNITISGGSVTATGGNHGAGIGDGSGGSGGSFATGTDGHALIVASSISDKSRRDSWSGIIFEGNTGTVYGNPTIQENMEIPSGKTLTVPENTTLTVKDGVTLTNNGTITGNGTLDGEGNLVGSGTVANIIRNNLQKDSNVTVEVSSSPATYGSKVDIRATISKATNAITLAAENQNQVEFFVGTDSNKKSLGTAKVRGDAATLSDVEISQEKGFAVGENTITAEYGGSMGLKPQTGSTRLTVQGDLKDAIVTVNGEYFYTNSPITPEVSVTWNGTRLTKDADYTLAYTNHTNAGKATVTVTGTGNYTGTKTESFTIGKAKQAALSITGKPSTPIIYGQEFTLSADGGSGRGAVTWAVTSNPAYATVDNTGKVQITGVGAVAITATKAEDANYKETAATYDFTTQKAIPLVGTVSKTSPETIYPTTALADIALSRTNTTVAGTLALDADQTLSVGTNTYNWTFTPNDMTNYENVTGTIQLEVKADELQSIKTEGNLGKSNYTWGEEFSLKGITVKAVYESGTEVDVTKDVTYSKTLAVGQTTVEISYEGQKCNVNITVDKATYGDKTASGLAKKGASGTVDLSALIVEGGEASIEGEPPAGSLLTEKPTITNGKLKFTFKNDANMTKPETVTVKVTSTNYADYTITVTLTVTDKDVPTVKANDITVTYTGERVPEKEIKGTAMFDGKAVEGTWRWKDTEAITNVADSGPKTVLFTPSNNTDYAEAQTTITVTIKKAKPNGAPKYDLIKEDGKKLGDANLTIGNITPAGTIAWKLGVTTKVEAGVKYEWVFTPQDTTNYETLTDKVMLYTKSAPVTPPGGGSSGGGGGSSRPSSSTGKTDTTTTTKPDGTKVQTETKPDGTKIQTETKKDGSVTKTTTNPNGSSVTETKAADGSTGTVKTDKNGQTTAETALSSKAIEDAKKNGEAVKAPVEVKASRNSNTAPTVKIELPKNSGDTKVEIPVSNVKPGTVAVLVHPDGTEEIVKNSLPTEDGIQLTVNGGATVKIVDNSKDFIDTQDHWAKDAIDFVSARELVNGISATRYAPDASATRAQLWTILARQNDADLNGGNTWYEKAQLWSKDKGISDGTNPDATINRAQMVTMLWRAAGSPAAQSGTAFQDVAAGSYYAQAVAWAVEGGITAGVGGGRFDPNSTCTRAQIATFLHRSYLSK